ncbi:ferrochelatase 2 [Paenibacillus sp. J2TS4]|nr:ferrochelatase 2 [Paenibacillus sp. J2TS4]
MIGLVLTAYGMVSSLDELEDFYTHIYHGKKPDEDKMAQALAQYRSLGVCDPLYSVTRRQAEALERRLASKLEQTVKSYVICKHTPPFAAETAAAMIADGVSRAVILPLSPLYSKTGAGWYERDLREALPCERPVELLPVYHWHLFPEFVQIVAQRVRTAAAWLPAKVRGRTTVVFTAHSQPGRPEAHPEYCEQFQALAEAVAQEAGCVSWRSAYRSGNPAPQTWLGPDVLEVIEEEKAAGTEAIVVCDLLSLTENVELLYDIGVEGQARAEALGMEFVRTGCLNDSDDFMNVMLTIVMERLAEAGWNYIN